MDELVRAEILSMSRAVHRLTESAYQQDSSTRVDSGWSEKQRVLLADMALHLLQTALSSGELSKDDLKRNLFSILMVSDQFMPGQRLKAAAEALHAC